MTLVTVLVAALWGSSAFAYGHSVSTGEGFQCRLEIESHAPVTCVPHVAWESAPEPIAHDVTGQAYTTVRQEIDNPECLESLIWGTYRPVLGAGTVSATLDGFNRQLISTSARYKNDNGVIDTEMRGGVLYYIYKAANVYAAEADQKLLQATFDREIGHVVASYVAPSAGAGGVLTMSTRSGKFDFPVHFEAGASSRDPGFAAVFEKDLTSNAGRVLHAQLRCTPISKHVP